MKLAQLFKEEQIYRIDHYLAKGDVAEHFKLSDFQTIFLSRAGAMNTLKNFNTAFRKNWRGEAWSFLRWSRSTSGHGAKPSFTDVVSRGNGPSNKFWC